MRRNYSYLFGAFVGWLLCGCVLKAEAQAASEYCYQSCFGSLDEAEAQMRAALPYGAYLVRDKINITGGASDTPSYQIGYKVKRQPPSDMSLPGYTIGGAGSADGICTANSEPFLQSYCVDEAQMIQGILDFYHRISPDCTISSERIDGAYGEPFVRSMPHYGAGYLVFDAPGGKWFRFNLSCPGWSDPTPTPHDRLLVKRQIYSCPAGLYPFDAFNPVYNNTGNPDFVAEYPYLCQNGDTPMIYAKGIDQTKSCAANANPCLPATGDKFSGG